MVLLEELARSRVHFFTGKGGVGKSTVVAALALALAERGKRPLVVELGHRASMGSIFGGREVEYRPREIAPGVFAMNVSFESALKEYIADQLRIPGLATLALSGKALRRFFEAAPAVAEIVTLKKLEKLERETRRGGPRYDPILVDLDATGHALMLFELPRVFKGIARSGPLAEALDSFSALLRDESKARLHVVAIPSEVPVNETLELCEAMRARTPLEIGMIVVNRVPPAPPEEGGQDEVTADAAELSLRARLVRRYERAGAAIERLGAAGVKLALLPEVQEVQATAERSVASATRARLERLALAAQEDR